MNRIVTKSRTAHKNIFNLRKKYFAKKTNANHANFNVTSKGSEGKAFKGEEDKWNKHNQNTR